jgi:hypothetical protein
MRAIIIQDHDAKALLDQLKLEQFTDPAILGVDACNAWQSIPLSVRGVIMQNLHRKFQYIVAVWLQEQGVKLH